MNDINQLKLYTDALGVPLTEQQLDQFLKFYELLVEWNSFMNLTAITEFDDVLVKHFADSLSLVKGAETDLIRSACRVFGGEGLQGANGAAEQGLHKDGQKGETASGVGFAGGERLQAANGATEQGLHKDGQKGKPASGVDFDSDVEKISLLDVGCGAGFPSVPLKIAFPALKITMLDSLNKRIKFLNEVITQLDLKDMVALHGRAEDYARQKEHRGNYDIVVSRAVANLSTLSEYCLPYVRKGGIFVSYKSEEFRDSDERKNAMQAIKLLGGELEHVYEYQLPASDYYRCLCVVRKVKETPSKYPRKAGLPTKEPL